MAKDESTKQSFIESASSRRDSILPITQVRVLVCASRPINERIEHQRGEMFGAMAVVAIARDSVNCDENYDLWRSLDDAYERFYKIALELNLLSSEAAKLSREVCHG